MIDKVHDHCATCDWLGREAERTATQLGKDNWTSITEVGRIEHRADYLEDDQ